MNEVDSVFADVRVNENGPNSCSPRQIDPNWRGILLRAPSRAIFAPSALTEGKRLVGIIPLCGFRLLEVAIARRSGPLEIVAQEIGTAKEYRGVETILDPSPIVPRPFKRKPLSDEELGGLASGGYFNPNLLDFVELPARPAKYMVHFEQAGMRSNHVVIEIVASSK